MAFQQSKNLMKSCGVGLEMAVVKFKINSGATAPTILAGAELINAGTGGSITCTTNTNACVVGITFNSSVVDVPWVQSEMRDNAAAGGYVTTGNVNSEATSNNLSLNVAIFNAGGATVQTNTAQGNVVSVCLVYRYSGVDKGN